MKGVLTLTAALLTLALPTSAAARTDCSYAPGPVYAETTSGSSGTSDSADIAAGLCVDTGSGNFQGGLVEGGIGLDNGELLGQQDILGARVPGVYVIWDGDDTNTLVTDGLGGYAGVSNYENHERQPCSQVPSGSGTNSGGCLVIRSITQIGGVPVACGNVAGKSWENSARDGCDPTEFIGCCPWRSSTRDHKRGARE